jgi:hypothetical protein
MDPRRPTSHTLQEAKRPSPPNPVHISNLQLPKEDIKCLRPYLDGGLTWQKHIFAKWKQLGITLTKMYWLLGRKSLNKQQTSYT